MEVSVGNNNKIFNIFSTRGRYMNSDLIHHYSPAPFWRGSTYKTVNTTCNFQHHCHPEPPPPFFFMPALACFVSQRPSFSKLPHFLKEKKSSEKMFFYPRFHWSMLFLTPHSKPPDFFLHLSIISFKWSVPPAPSRRGHYPVDPTLV